MARHVINLTTTPGINSIPDSTSGISVIGNGVQLGVPIYTNQVVSVGDILEINVANFIGLDYSNLLRGSFGIVASSSANIKQTFILNNDLQVVDKLINTLKNAGNNPTTMKLIIKVVSIGAATATYFPVSGEADLKKSTINGVPIFSPTIYNIPDSKISLTSVGLNGRIDLGSLSDRLVDLKEGDIIKFKVRGRQQIYGNTFPEIRYYHTSSVRSYQFVSDTVARNDFGAALRDTSKEIYFNITVERSLIITNSQNLRRTEYAIVDVGPKIIIENRQVQQAHTANKRYKKMTINNHIYTFPDLPPLGDVTFTDNDIKTFIDGKLM